MELCHLIDVSNTSKNMYKGLYQDPASFVHFLRIKAVEEYRIRTVLYKASTARCLPSGRSRQAGHPLELAAYYALVPLMPLALGLPLLASKPPVP